MKPFLISALALASLLFLSCAQPTLTHAFLPHVEYLVTGTAASVDLGYSSSEAPFGESRKYAVSLPWSYSYNDIPCGLAFVRAQNTGTSGLITVDISVGGVLQQSQTGSGIDPNVVSAGIILPAS